jgi:uncharacterized membrane protein YfhO
VKAPDNADVTITAHLVRGGYVILDDLFYPGWSATVDGHAATIEPSDGLLRAVKVPEGTHTIRFTYAPTSVKLGELLTAIGLLIAAATAISKWRRPH